MPYPPFRIGSPPQLEMTIDMISHRPDDVLILSSAPPTISVLSDDWKSCLVDGRRIVLPELKLLGENIPIPFAWFDISRSNYHLLPRLYGHNYYRHAAGLRTDILRIGETTFYHPVHELPEQHRIRIDAGKTNRYLVKSGILKMNPNNFSVKTFDDLMSMRALTGVTRITEHHLVNRKTTRCFADQWLIKGSVLEDANAIVDYLTSCGFFVEFRYEDPLGRPSDRSITSNTQAALNAYNISDVGLVRSLINVMISDTLVVTCYQIDGEPNLLMNIRDLLTHRLVDKPIKLRYLTGFSPEGKPLVDTREIDKELNRPLDLFYPCIEEGIVEFANAFEKSINNLLFMISGPGTGKSTLIRELCRQYKHRPLYQFAGDKVVDHPGFDSFLASLPANAICIMEDAENLVGKRTEGNTSMALLLNEIDGIANKNIKFIISTNFENRKHVDGALFRPGRCFRTLEFDKLNVEQGRAICHEMQLDRAEFLDTYSKFTLAELLSDGGDHKVKDQAVGFKL